jgi:lantibiotic modifying enzyme
MTAWCHGATGVGMSRVVLLRRGLDDFLRDELDIAVRTTLREGFGSSHSLCHGDMGSLELLLQCHLLDADAMPRVSLMAHASQVLESVNRTGWQCGNPSRIESPDLMTGIAGVGYELLRLADPATTPAVLTLSGTDAAPDSLWSC